MLGLKNLEDLNLHEFGSVDLHPLRSMPWLKGLYCGYANDVYDIDAILFLKEKLDGLEEKRKSKDMPKEY